MSKTKAAKPAKKNAGKTDKLKELKVPNKKPSPKSNGVVTEPLSTFQTPKTGRELPVINSNLVINSVSVEKDTDFLIFKGVINGNSLKRKGEDTYEAAVHENLKKAIQAFAPHLIVLANYCPASRINDKGEYEQLLKSIKEVPTDLVDDCTITKLHFKHGKNKNFQIVGHLKTFRGSHQILVSPKENLEADNDSAYELLADAKNKINYLQTRIEKYFSGEERGIIVQELPFGDASTPAKKDPMTSGEEVDVTDEYHVAEETE